MPYCSAYSRHSDKSFAPSTFWNPLQINFLATSTLAAYSALPARASVQVLKWFHLVSVLYVLCCPVSVSYLLHYCVFLSSF